MALVIMVKESTEDVGLTLISAVLWRHKPKYFTNIFMNHYTINNL